jgi:Protein of unknown function (DUF3617)
MRRLALTAAALVAAAPAFAYDMPMRKAGLWDLKMEFVGSNLPGREMKQCTDASSDKLMTANFGGSAAGACSKNEVKNTGGVITVDSVCNFGGATSTSHAVISGSFDSAYTVEVTSTREGGRPVPGMAPGGQTHMKITAKWLGACAKGQRPGDIVMNNGMTVNILDLQKMGGMPRGAPPRR